MEIGIVLSADRRRLILTSPLAPGGNILHTWVVQCWLMMKSWCHIGSIGSFKATPLRPSRRHDLTLVRHYRGEVAAYCMLHDLVRSLDCSFGQVLG